MAVASFDNLEMVPVRAPLTKVAGNELVPVMVNVVFTTAGAVGSYTGTPGVVPTKPAGTGLYRITIPKAKAVYLAGAHYYAAAGDATHTLHPQVKSTTVVDIVHGVSAAAANATDADSMDVCLWVEL